MCRTCFAGDTKMHFKVAVKMASLVYFHLGISQSVKRFGFRLGTTMCRVLVGVILFAKVIFDRETFFN